MDESRVSSSGRVVTAGAWDCLPKDLGRRYGGLSDVPGFGRGYPRSNRSAVNDSARTQNLPLHVVGVVCYDELKIGLLKVPPGREVR